MIEQTIRPEYLNAHFLVDAFPRKWPYHFFVITAFNPYDEIVDFDENAKRNESLRNALGRLGLSFFNIIGCSPDTIHQEPSFGVERLTVERAREIGRLYHQIAVFEIYGDRLTVIGCALGERGEAGSFPERLIYPGADIPGGRNNPVLIESNSSGINSMIDDRFGKECWKKTRDWTERDGTTDAFYCWEIELFNGSREVLWFKRNYFVLGTSVRTNPLRNYESKPTFFCVHCNRTNEYEGASPDNCQHCGKSRYGGSSDLFNKLLIIGGFILLCFLLICAAVLREIL
jgi:hypothetical protein